MSFIHSFEIRPGSAGRSGTRPTRGQVEKKIDEGKTRCDPIDPPRPGCKPVDFCFFFLLKRRRFDFFFLRIDSADPIKPGDPAKTRNPSLGPGWPPGRVLKLCPYTTSMRIITNITLLRDSITKKNTINRLSNKFMLFMSREMHKTNTTKCTKIKI
jgi:hypothetical protein